MYYCQVLLLGNRQFPGNNTRKFGNFQLPGNNTQKLTKRPKCWVNFWVTIPQNFQFQSIVTSEIDKFPGNNTRKLYNFRVTILWNWKCPGMVTQKLTQHFCLLVNFRVLLPKSWKLSNFRVLLPGNWQFPSYYVEIGQFPGIYTWKFINFRVTIPGNSTTKKKGNFNIRVTIPGSCKFPGIVTKSKLKLKMKWNKA